MNIQYAILPAVLSTCHVTDVQAQKQVMRKFEKYLAGASPKIKSDPPAPSTPPLWDDISAFLNARNDAAPLGLDVAPEKQQQEGTEERKRKSHLISASPPASPPAPAPSLQDEATPSIDQVGFCWSKLKANFPDANTMRWVLHIIVGLEYASLIRQYMFTREMDVLGHGVPLHLV